MLFLNILKMSTEDNILLTATAIGTIYLCIDSIKGINNSKYSCIDFDFYYNYFVLGISGYVFMSIVKYTVTKN
jgi:hypothetical protein